MMRLQLSAPFFVRGHVSVGLISVLPVAALTGCDMFIPSKEAMRSLVPHSWLKVFRVSGCL